MITELKIYESTGFNTHWNLALEKRLMDTVMPGTCILYLWQNQNTVVIGRNQNPWLECRTSLLEQEGGTLARRLSGGGAVFHDLGNLNFTFIMRKEDYDLDKQLSVLQAACQLAGIQAERSGRNDLLADGRKFSGNAFYQNSTHAYHHGTIMINVDREKLGRYLSPPKAKLEAKGVTSVRSRVVNLTELAPDLTIDKMKSYMVSAFEQVYGYKTTPVTLAEEEAAIVRSLHQEYGSWEYLFGTPLPFTFQCEGHFPWGHVQLQIEAKNGVIIGVKLYSDAMDWSLSELTETALTGCRFETTTMQAALEKTALSSDLCKDLCSLIASQSL